MPAEADQAAFWITKAAEQNLPNAQLFLSGMYEAGIGVPKDHEKAKYWSGKADNAIKDVLPLLMPTL
ncbi:SEL1-like repeat protein [Rhizobium sp. R693]|uniref:SEL1-like repeat protein n=1 Tax=Rhizobium sp. R693 TaxID=1764276 RepID=UPI000B532704|nr:SEL1-like repeat protein [Rhizobium sp. R693]OWV99972.1 hypothetical protein ATY79_01045 [Rhizobium sp. R693]